MTNTAELVRPPIQVALPHTVLVLTEPVALTASVVSEQLCSAAQAEGFLPIKSAVAYSGHL